MFDDDSEPVTAAVLNDVSDSLFEQEIVDGSIDAAIVAENEQQPADNITKETTLCSPPQNQKTRSLREIYEHALVTDDHLQYALFSSDPTIFEEALNDAQWNQANEVVVIDQQHQDVNALQEKLKYIHIFSNKNVQCVGKDENQKNHVEIEDEDFHYVPKDEEDQLLSIKIQKKKKKNSKYTSRKKFKLKCTWTSSSLSYGS